MRLPLVTSLITFCQLSDVSWGFATGNSITRTTSLRPIWKVSHLAASNDEDTESNDEDGDFAAMKLQIELMMLDTPATSPSAAPSKTAVSVVNYNKLIAVASAIFGSFFFVFQHSQPVSGVALMHAMERDSVDLKVAVCNGKPTIIDFYADWCESCKVMAPSMRMMETQYKDRINFISIDGSNSKNADMVRRFRVDGIPHLAFISSDQEVKTALVGSVPRPVLKDQIVALIQGKEMPYEGFDAFEEESHFPLRDVSSTCAADP